jgi:hypothetical protein
MDETRVATPRHQVQLKKRSHHKKAPRVKVFEAKPFPVALPTAAAAASYLSEARDGLQRARQDEDTAKWLRQGLCLIAALTAPSWRKQDRVRDPRLLRSTESLVQEAWWLVWTGHTHS